MVVLRRPKSTDHPNHRSLWQARVRASRRWGGWKCSTIDSRGKQIRFWPVRKVFRSMKTSWKSEKKRSNKMHSTNSRSLTKFSKGDRKIDLASWESTVKKKPWVCRPSETWWLQLRAKLWSTNNSVLRKLQKTLKRKQIMTCLKKRKTSKQCFSIKLASKLKRKQNRQPRRMI